MNGKSILVSALVCFLSVGLLPIGKISAAETPGNHQSFEGNLVDIGGGRHLNMVCQGRGSPTVIFLQGLGGAMTSWNKVRDPVSGITRVCLYDRAGFGYSDPSNLPSTAANIVKDLHALLHAAGITGRVILVGHSFGGLLATLYTDRFESQVAGLVLVDPSFFDQFDYSISPHGKDAILAGNSNFLELLRTCKSLAAARKLSKTDPHGCFHFPPNPTKAEADYFTYEFARPAYYESGISEVENFYPTNSWISVDGVEEMRERRSFGTIPLEVLTRGIASPDPHASEADNQASEQYWKLGHNKLAARSTRGEVIIVPQSGHNIQIDQPQRVVDAIRKVVLEAREIGSP